MAGTGSGISLLDHFAALQDPRQAWKVLYPLPEILLLLLAATLAGADDFVEARLWGRQNLAFLRRFLPYQHGVPSHDTLGDVVNALDPGLFKTCFVSWVAQLRETEPDIVAIDGKTSRRSHARSKGRAPLHLVSALRRRWRRLLRSRIGQRPMGQPAAAGAGPGGGGRQVERDHRDHAPPGAPDAHRRPGHDRSQRDRSGRFSEPRPKARQAMPSAARPGSQGRSWRRKPTICWR